jgi:hypothetical protein
MLFVAHLRTPHFCVCVMLDRKLRSYPPRSAPHWCAGNQLTPSGCLHPPVGHEIPSCSVANQALALLAWQRGLDLSQRGHASSLNGGCRGWHPSYGYWALRLALEDQVRPALLHVGFDFRLVVVYALPPSFCIVQSLIFQWLMSYSRHI